MGDKRLGEVTTRMAVFARSGEQASSRRGAPWKLVLAPLVVLVMALGFAVAAEAAYAQRALPGISIGGIASVSLERDALRDRLDRELAAPWAGATVTLSGDGRSWRATNADLGIAPELDAAVAEALAYGKTGSVLDRVGAWIDALRGDANIPFTMRSRGDALDRWVAAAARDVDRVPVSGEIRVTGKGLEHPGKSAKYQVSAEGAVTIIPSESGVRIDQARLRALFLDELLRPAAGPTREVAAPAAVDASAFTTEQAKELAPRLSLASTFTTYYPPSGSRHANISTGASQFDGVVIMPGQTFSFWELLGPVTVERGYTYAGAIINNRSAENVIGGGLCQASPTIFNAASRQDHQTPERPAHGH